MVSQWERSTCDLEDLDNPGVGLPTFQKNISSDRKEVVVSLLSVYLL